MDTVTGGPRPAMPATGISWNEAARFVNWLNVSQGHPVAYKFHSQPGDPGYHVERESTALGAHRSGVRRRESCFGTGRLDMYCLAWMSGTKPHSTTLMRLLKKGTTSTIPPEATIHQSPSPAERIQVRRFTGSARDRDPLTSRLREA